MLKQFHRKWRKKEVILTQLAARFSKEKPYTESEVNEIIMKAGYEPAQARSELVAYAYFIRDRSGMNYWKISDKPQLGFWKEAHGKTGTTTRKDVYEDLVREARQKISRHYPGGSITPYEFKEAWLPELKYQWKAFLLILLFACLLLALGIVARKNPTFAASKLIEAFGIGGGVGLIAFIIYFKFYQIRKMYRAQRKYEKRRSKYKPIIFE